MQCVQLFKLTRTRDSKKFWRDPNKKIYSKIYTIRKCPFSKFVKLQYIKKYK